MNDNNDFLAGILLKGAHALAGYASRDLLDKFPQAQECFGPDPFSGWQNWLSVRLDELAAAVAANRPRLFISQVLWGQAALKSRGIPLESFRAGLQCLRDVLDAELPEQVRTLAADYLDQALKTFEMPSVEPSTPLLPDTEVGRLASNYLLVLLEGDRRRASRLILEALDKGHDVNDLYLQVLMPAQEELGRMWLNNEINVAEEHLASQTTKVVMAQLLPRASLQPPNGKTMLAASVSGNHHDIGLQAVADFFEMDGWRTVLLGADVPAHDLVQAVDYFGADLLGISVSQSTHIQSAKMTIQTVRDSVKNKDITIILGGRAFMNAEDLPKEMGADGYASHPTEAVALARVLMGID